MNEIQTTTEARPPAPMTREISDLIAGLSSALERSADGKRWEIAESRLSHLTGARGALEARQAELRRSLARAPHRTISEAIKAMFLRFPSSANAPDMAARITVYVSDLSEFPMWAITKAIEAHSRAQFAPSSALLVDAARSAKADVVDEGLKIDRLLRAEVRAEQSPADRAMVERGYRDLVDKLRENEPFDMHAKPQGRPLTRQEAEQAVDAMKAAPVDLPPLSEAARAVLARSA